jgi:DNA replication protein DnaC
MFYNNLTPKLQKIYKENNNEQIQVQLETKETKELQCTRNYYFFGCNGSGKTRASILLAKQFIAKYSQKKGIIEAMNLTKFIKFKELLDLFKNFSDESKNNIEKLKKCTFLIIDDFGAGYGKEYSLNELEEFVDYRYQQGNKMITQFTTNVDFKAKENQELRQSLSRAISRINEMCEPILLLQTDHRSTQEKDEFNFDFDDEPDTLILKFIDCVQEPLEKDEAFELRAKNLEAETTIIRKLYRSEDDKKWDIEVEKKLQAKKDSANKPIIEFKENNQFQFKNVIKKM